MAHIPDLNVHQKTEETQKSSAPDGNNLHPSEDLGIAIQSLIQQLRKAPLQRIG